MPLAEKFECPADHRVVVKDGMGVKLFYLTVARQEMKAQHMV